MASWSLHRSQVRGWAPVIALIIGGFHIPCSCELLPQGLVLVGPGSRREVWGLGGWVCCATLPTRTDPTRQGGHRDEQDGYLNMGWDLGLLDILQNQSPARAVSGLHPSWTLTACCPGATGPGCSGCQPGGKRRKAVTPTNVRGGRCTGNRACDHVLSCGAKCPPAFPTRL